METFPSTAESGRMVVVAATVLILGAAAGAAFAAFGPMASAGLLGIAVVVATLRSPAIGLALLAFLIPVESAIVAAGGDKAVKALLILVVLAWLVRKILTRESFRPVFASPFVILAMLFLVLAVTSTTWALHTTMIQSQLARLASVIALSIVAADVTRDGRKADLVIRMLVLGALVAVALTLVQYFGVGGVRRAGGDITGGINATALLFVSVVPFAFYLFRGGGPPVWRLLGLAYVAAALIAVSVTFSRMSMLLLPLLLLVELGATIRTKRGILAVLFLFVVALPVAWLVLPLDKIIDRASTIGPYVEQTLGGSEPGLARVSSRGFHLKVATEIFAEHPIVGVGYGNFGMFFLQYQLDVPGSSHLYRTPRSAHSSYFAMLADLGLIGISLFLALMFVAGFAAWTAVRQLKPPGGRDQLRARALFVCILVLGLYGFYAELHRDKFFWLVLGMCSAAVALVGSRTPATDSATREAEVHEEPRRLESRPDVIPIARFS